MYFPDVLRDGLVLEISSSEVEVRYVFIERRKEEVFSSSNTDHTSLRDKHTVSGSAP